MFPKRITDDTPHKGITTLYPLFTDKLTGNEIFIRCQLKGTFWNDSAGTNFLKNGILTANAVQLFIPIDPKVTGRIYVSPAEWNGLSHDEAKEKYWTLDPRQTTSMPIMVKGASDFEFRFQSPTAPTGADPPRLPIQRRDFLESNPMARAARIIDEQFFGDKNKWHLLVTV